MRVTRVFAVAAVLWLGACSTEQSKIATNVGAADSAAAVDAAGAPDGEATDDVMTVDTAPVNNPPVATDDLASGVMGSDIMILVLDNDSDPDKDIIKIKEVSQGQLGVIAINPGGYSLTWSPVKPYKTGVDSFKYTIHDGKGGTDEATVTIKIDPPPSIEITSPDDGQKLGVGPVTVSFKVNGCNFTGPSSDPGGCHAHNFLDGEKFKDANGKGFGQYQLKPFSIGELKPGKHVFKMVLIKNDGSDQPFEPELADEIAFEVTSTTAP